MRMLKMAKRIITEADVRKMEMPAELLVDNGTVITPSAIDAAHARGIRILYRRAKEPSKPSTLFRKISSLGDGDYLLQVRSGETRLFEIRDDGVHPIRGK